MNVIDWLQVHWIDIVYVVLAVIIALFISKLLERTIRRTLIKKISKTAIDNMTKLLRYVIIILAVTITLASLGVDLTGALVAGGIIGIVIGFAAQASVSNLISGILLLLEKPFKLGDFIHVGDIVGAVVEVGLLSTTIVTWEGIKVRIPSSELFNSSFRNYSASRIRVVRVNVQIPYSESIEKAAQAITSKLREQWYILEEPEPMVFAKEFANDGIVLEVRAWTPGSTWFTLYSNLPKLVKDALDEAGIEIPFPQRVVWFASSLKTEEKESE
ncbi:MAG: mechanosensitive ion channel family protein [Thermoprotei archaeon]|nr:MAG: mechanosensitive ion channel family protein [Thermoprotei archaeon]